MKRFFLLGTTLLLLGSCVKSDFGDNPKKTDKPEEWYDFDFSTVRSTGLEIRYTDLGGIEAPVYFEIYDTCPVRTNEAGTAYEKIEGIQPLYAGMTGKDGSFSGKVDLPAYLDHAYIYTPAFYAQTLLEAELRGGVLAADDRTSSDEAEAKASTRALGNYDTDAVTRDGWKTYLGDYDSYNGTIDYVYSGPLKIKNYASLYIAHSSVINSKKKCPEEYRSSKDLLIKEPAEVAVTFLGSNTCWNCSMGYYFYENGHKPRSLAEANVILIFPNTQDGQWSNNKSLAKRYKGIDRGTTVQLLYYPDINDPQTATTAFPANYRIGFVLATNAWQRRLTGFDRTLGYRAATSDGLSVNDRGIAYDGPRTAVYRYTNSSEEMNSVVFSFEDYIDDENFSDVVFTLNSNPVEAVTDIPSVDQDGISQTVKVVKGTYSFEDLWPSRGDYDMNDVLVKTDYEKTFNNNGIATESFLFTTYDNLTGLKNGLAVTLGGSAATGTLNCSVKQPDQTEFEPAEFTREGNVLLLTENVKEHINSTYKITVTYATPVQDGGTAVPFLLSTTRKNLASGKRWELHLPYEAPTGKMDMTFFGKDDDRSVPEKGVYYVRQQMYPFAFFLSGATETDLRRLLDPANEKKAIDIVYPDYKKWAESQGTTNKDWYKR